MSWFAATSRRSPTIRWRGRARVGSARSAPAPPQPPRRQALPLPAGGAPPAPRRLPPLRQRRKPRQRRSPQVPPHRRRPRLPGPRPNLHRRLHLPSRPGPPRAAARPRRPHPLSKRRPNRSRPKRLSSRLRPRRRHPSGPALLRRNLSSPLRLCPRPAHHRLPWTSRCGQRQSPLRFRRPRRRRLPFRRVPARAPWFPARRVRGPELGGCHSRHVPSPRRRPACPAAACAATTGRVAEGLQPPLALPHRRPAAGAARASAARWTTKPFRQTSSAP